MSKEWEEYIQDPRIVCKYGIKCYQKNPQHHVSFKHPPNLRHNKDKCTKQRHSPYTRNVNSPKTNVDKTRTQVNQQDSGVPETSKVYKPVEESQDKEVPSTHLLPKDLTYYKASTDRDLLKELFLVEFPADFYNFYEFLNEDNNIEKSLASVNLELIGPYDLLKGKLPELEDRKLYLIHWRFFYDPPEFQAVIKKKGKSEYHIGYFRDDPSELPVFVSSNDSAKDCHIKPMSDNLFGAVYLYLQHESKSSPFTAIACKKMMDKIKSYAEKNNITLEEYNMKTRQSKIITKTFHGAGIIVPYNKKTQLGYRRLVETDANLKKLFTKLKEAKSQDEKDTILSDLQPVITYASIAVDECDFGTGLEAGIDLFCSGLKELEPSALSSLTAVYSLLNREAFSKIIQAHLKLRRKGPNVSLISLSDS